MPERKLFQVLTFTERQVEESSRELVSNRGKVQAVEQAKTTNLKSLNKELKN